MSVTIRNEIVAVNDSGPTGLDGATTYALSPYKIHIDTSDYNGVLTWSFQVTAVNPNVSVSYYVRLVNSNGDTEAEITVPNNTATPTFFEVAFEATKPDDTYMDKGVIIENNELDIYSAQVVCKQVTSNGLTDKMTLVECGDKAYISPTTLQATANWYPFSYDCPFYYDSANWDNAPTFYFEACSKDTDSTKGGHYLALEESDSSGDFQPGGSITLVTNTEISFLTNVWTVVRTSSSWQPTSGRMYRMVHRFADNKYSNFDVSNAKIVIKQTGGTITKFEERYFFKTGPLTRGFTGSTVNQQSINEVDSSFWDGVNVTYYYEHYADNASNQSQVLESPTPGSWQAVANSAVTGSKRQRSAAISPGNYNIDTAAINID